MVLVTRPPMTDDDGTFTSGTAVDKAFIDALLDQVDDQTHSTGSPTVKPKDIVTEVVAARGASVDLEARLDAVDTSLTEIVDTTDIQGILGQINNVANDTFLIWPAGDTAAPSYWTLGGGGATIQRCGNGLVDTNTKIGNFCVRITRVAALTQFSQNILNAITVGDVTLADSSTGFGAWVRSTVIGGARLYIKDNVGTSYSIANVLANTWEWLSVARVMDAAAAAFIVGLENTTDGSSAYISGATAMFMPQGLVPSRWSPCPAEYESYEFYTSGAVTVGVSKFLWQAHRPGLVLDTQIIAGTAPTGADLIVDVNTWDGAAYTSMYTTKPKIVAAGFTGGNQPDTTYARRCLALGSGTGTAAGTRLSIDIDQVGSGVAGSNVNILVHVLHYLRPFRSRVTYFEDLG